MEPIEFNGWLVESLSFAGHLTYGAVLEAVRNSVSRAI